MLSYSDYKNKKTQNIKVLSYELHIKFLTKTYTRKCYIQGISPVPLPPEVSFLLYKPRVFFTLFSGQALDRLVTVSSIHCCTSTSVLSTWSSSRGLTSFCYGISHLEGGFTLRCLQRLSLPDLATRLCTWQYNRYTSGPSNPVLSY